MPTTENTRNNRRTNSATPALFDLDANATYLNISKPPTVVHPARFSPQIIATVTGLIPTGARVHDPFAGTGERLGRLADDLGVTFTGTEIEPSFIVSPRVNVGDSTDPETYPPSPFVVVTSPVYPNGMADHFAATDGSHRNTYRAAVASNEGVDRPLHPKNMGCYGYRGTGPTSTKRAMYWRLAEAVVACWGGANLAIVNTSDFMARGKIEAVTEPWKRLLKRCGWQIEDVHRVKTARNGYGANGDVRVNHEDIIVATHKLGAD